MKRFYFYGLLSLLLSTEAKAQLHVRNPSFEALGISPDFSKTQYYIPGWHYCINENNGELGIYSAYKWYDTSNYTPPSAGKPSSGFYFIELLARTYQYSFDKILYPDAIRETISSKLKCGIMLKNHYYNIAFDCRKDFNPDFGDPYVYIYESRDTCDTTFILYENFIRDTSWRKVFISFESKDNCDYLSIRCRHMYKDTTTIKGRNYVQFYLDNLSPVTPDTAYNSAHFPIRVQALGMGLYRLRSPYSGEQYWYEGATLLGSGDSMELSVRKPRTVTLVLGKDSCIPSVLQTSIVPEGDADALLFPSAFTPDGDGRNDLFRPVQQAGLNSLQQYELSVYNRWGQHIWQSSNALQGWDGTGAGIGVYFWLCRYTLPGGGKRVLKGDVSLLR